MRRKVTVETLKQFMQELAAAARSPGKVYFTGGATALLLGFRQQTIDTDLKMDPEPEGAGKRVDRTMAFACAVASIPHVGQFTGAGIRPLTSSTSNLNFVPHWRR